MLFIHILWISLWIIYIFWRLSSWILGPLSFNKLWICLWILKFVSPKTPPGLAEILVKKNLILVDKKMCIN